VQNMVLFKQTARQDLEEIRIGLLYWEKIELSKSFIHSYMDDIIDECYSLDKKNIRFKATYNDHLKHGTYVHTYKRNTKTTWYIIYNIDEKGNVLINRIISNYMTVS